MNNSIPIAPPPMPSKTTKTYCTTTKITPYQPDHTKQFTIKAQPTTLPQPRKENSRLVGSVNGMQVGEGPGKLYSSVNATPNGGVQHPGPGDPVTDAQMRKLVYNMYRGLLNTKHQRANTIVEAAPHNNISTDEGVAGRVTSMMRQQKDLAEAKMNYGPPPPPPPPPFATGAPPVRLPSEVAAAAAAARSPAPPHLPPINLPSPPIALAGAMMKDRKPFTYTPGGLNLNEIKSPRMQRRLQRNANSEGVPISPLAQPQRAAAPNQPCSGSPIVPHHGMIQVLPMPGMSMAPMPGMSMAPTKPQVQAPKESPKSKRNVCGPAPPPPPFALSSGSSTEPSETPYTTPATTPAINSFSPPSTPGTSSSPSTPAVNSIPNGPAAEPSPTPISGHQLHLQPMMASEPGPSGPIPSAQVHSAPINFVPVPSAPVPSAPVPSASVPSAPVPSAPVPPPPPPPMGMSQKIPLSLEVAPLFIPALGKNVVNINPTSASLATPKTNNSSSTSETGPESTSEITESSSPMSHEDQRSSSNKRDSSNSREYETSFSESEIERLVGDESSSENSKPSQNILKNIEEEMQKTQNILEEDTKLLEPRENETEFLNNDIEIATSPLKQFIENISVKNSEDIENLTYRSPDTKIPELVKELTPPSFNQTRDSFNRNYSNSPQNNDNTFNSNNAFSSELKTQENESIEISRPMLYQTVPISMEHNTNEPIFKPGITPPSMQYNIPVSMLNPPTIQPIMPISKHNPPTIQPPMPISKPNPPAMQPPMAISKPNPPTIQPPMAISKPNIPAMQPPMAISKPNPPTIQPPMAISKPNPPAMQPHMPISNPNPPTMNQTGHISRQDQPLMQQKAKIQGPDHLVIRSPPQDIRWDSSNQAPLKPTDNIVRAQPPIVRPIARMASPPPAGPKPSPVVINPRMMRQASLPAQPPSSPPASNEETISPTMRNISPNSGLIRAPMPWMCAARRESDTIVPEFLTLSRKNQKKIQRQRSLPQQQQQPKIKEPESQPAAFRPVFNPQSNGGATYSPPVAQATINSPVQVIQDGRQHQDSRNIWTSQPQQYQSQPYQQQQHNQFNSPQPQIPITQRQQAPLSPQSRFMQQQMMNKAAQSQQSPRPRERIIPIMLEDSQTNNRSPNQFNSIPQMQAQLNQQFQQQSGWAQANGGLFQPPNIGGAFNPFDNQIQSSSTAIEALQQMQQNLAQLNSGLQTAQHQPNAPQLQRAAPVAENDAMMQSRSFKVLQNVYDNGQGPEEFVAVEPKKYTGANIPSRSFRMLQAMTDADEVLHQPPEEDQKEALQEKTFTLPSSKVLSTRPSIEGESRVSPSYTSTKDSPVYRSVTPKIANKGSSKEERIVNGALSSRRENSPRPWHNTQTSRTASPSPAGTSTARSSSSGFDSPLMKQESASEPEETKMLYDGGKIPSRVFRQLQNDYSTESTHKSGSSSPSVVSSSPAPSRLITEVQLPRLLQQVILAPPRTSLSNEDDVCSYSSSSNLDLEDAYRNGVFETAAVKESVMKELTSQFDPQTQLKKPRAAPGRVFRYLQEQYGDESDCKTPPPSCPSTGENSPNIFSSAASTDSGHYEMEPKPYGGTRIPGRTFRMLQENYETHPSVLQARK